MKFDCIIMNPPYAHGLHTDIFAVAQRHLSENGKCISLNPLDPYVKACKNDAGFISKRKRPIRVDAIDAISKRDANKLFEIGLSDCLGILTCDLSSKNMCNSNDFMHIVPNFEFFKFMKTRTFEVLKTKFEKTPAGFSLRYGIGCGANSGTKFGFGCTSFKHAVSQKASGHLAFLNFKTQQEQYNCWKSCWTDFMRFCLQLDDTIVPFVGNCKHPRTGNAGFIDEWTNDDFYSYFGVPKKFQVEIETFMRDNHCHRTCVNDEFVEIQ